MDRLPNVTTFNQLHINADLIRIQLPYDFADSVSTTISVSAGLYTIPLQVSSTSAPITSSFYLQMSNQSVILPSSISKCHILFTFWSLYTRPKYQ